MKNKLQDLNNHLFAQLERLADEDISEEEIKKETERSRAVIAVAQTIISNARLELDAHVAVREWNIEKIPPMIASVPEGKGK